MSKKHHITIKNLNSFCLADILTKVELRNENPRAKKNKKKEEKEPCQK